MINGSLTAYITRDVALTETGSFVGAQDHIFRTGARIAIVSEQAEVTAKAGSAGIGKSRFHGGMKYVNTINVVFAFFHHSVVIFACKFFARFNSSCGPVGPVDAVFEYGNSVGMFHDSF